MSDFVYSDLTYCTLCDRYFPGEEARAQHVQVSPNHPRCDTCNRRFANKNSLRNVSFARVTAGDLDLLPASIMYIHLVTTIVRYASATSVLQPVCVWYVFISYRYAVTV